MVQCPSGETKGSFDGIGRFVACRWYQVRSVVTLWSDSCEEGLGTGIHFELVFVDVLLKLPPPGLKSVFRVRVRGRRRHLQVLTTRGVWCCTLKRPYNASIYPL